MTRPFARVAILVAALMITLPPAAGSAGSAPSDRPPQSAGATAACRVRDTSTAIESTGDGANLQDEGGGIWMPKGGGSVVVCSPDVALSPNDPDDPPSGVARLRRP